MSTVMNSEEDDVYSDSYNGEGGTTSFRSSFERPILKLSVKLIDTYKEINKVYHLHESMNNECIVIIRHLFFCSK